MSGDLKALLKREKQLHHFMELIDRFIQNFDEERDLRQINIRLQKLEEVGKEFYDIRCKIELLQEDEVLKGGAEEDPEIKEEARQAREDSNFEVIHQFDNKFCHLKSELLDLQAETVQLWTHAATTQPMPTPVSRVRLPEIRLPSFGGKVREWVTFRDTFHSLIHNNNQLADVDKFTYLRSSLSGEALQEINSIELTAENYSVAWNALVRRYENKKLIVKAHIDALFSLESLKKESYDGINHLIGEFDKNLQMLNKIGEDTTGWSTLLAYMICSRLDSATLRLWETHHGSTEVPTYNNVIEFLRNHCVVLQSITISKASGTDNRQAKTSFCHATAKAHGKCPFCNESWHTAFHCARFQRMKVPERSDAVNKNSLCRNCLSPGHYARSCERGVCHHCRQKHHSMLHTNQVRSSVPSSSTAPQAAIQQSRQPQIQTKPSTLNQPAQTQSSNTPATSAHSQNTSTQSTSANAATSHNYVAFPTTQMHNILLSTALVKLTDRDGQSMLARALLDSCSQHCLMSKEFYKKLRFNEVPSYLAIQGIGAARSLSNKSVYAEVAARSSEISLFAEQMQFHVLPKLTVALPTANVNPVQWLLPKSTLLADPQFHEPRPVDVIIGAEFYMDLLKEGQVKATSEGPTLQNTVFGWIVSGRVPNSCSVGISSTAYACSTTEIQDQLTKFWELETCRTNSTNSIEESACEDHFEKTTVRDNEGRFVVMLPKKQFVISQLGDSKETAVRRFTGLEKRFSGNPQLKDLYTEFINEYQTLGHMIEVIDDSSIGTGYYLPHHAVLKPDSKTTKLRVVFDASCKTSTGVSLNDALMVGPVVQDDLIDITLRFRLHRYAIVADIAKMYRMVKVTKHDQQLQRILWRNSTDEQLRTYELTTVTYGTASAPYLATKCLQKLAEDGKQTHPIAARVLKQDFYVDDMLTGVNNIESGKQLVGDMIDLLKSAGFILRKWNSNCKEILLNVPENLRDDKTILELNSSNCAVKTLGLIWEPSSDTFRFSTPKWSTDIITKRTVLADVSRLFDPLGLVGPVIIQAKIFIQDLWKQECGWDEPLCEKLQEQWQEYRRNLTGLEGLTVPRWTGIGANVKSVEIHGFCDASEKAYGVCIYIRTISEQGEVNLHLLTSKSRVAPLENLKKKKTKQTIPRLELSSALLLSHVYEKVINSIRINAKAYFWTDSMIVKCWLASPPSRWKEFVANRVSEIQHITKNGTWNHIAGNENPADIISRGMSPVQLQYQSHWFRGPIWIMHESINWPINQPIHEEEIERSMLEEKETVTAMLQVVQPSEIFSLRSSWMDLIRLVALFRRFRFNAQVANRSCRKLGSISSDELDEAVRALIRLSQEECFARELSDISHSAHVRATSRIASLNPQLREGILCVGGRLRHAIIPASRRHPFIVDHRHPLATIIVRYYHLKLYHAGQQLIISTMRERFWPTNVRNLVRRVIHQCVACFRLKPKIHEQLMADLPPERVTPCAPFQRVGVDYCGPFNVVYPHRKRQSVKCFVAVFVCLVTKAIHLELVADLTTQAFLATLKRFAARRGKPDLIMCDNAKNFVGARRELDELRRLFLDQQFQNSVQKQTANESIEFRFIPARTPNFGGLWESAVKSFKTLLKRTIGSHSLVYDEMQTVLVQIEAILNSRPLTPLSNDSDDFEALTPGHFLIQRPLVAIPEPNLSEIPENRLSAWQKIQHYTQGIWKKWTFQYLSELHNRTKWMQHKENVAVGTMVVLKEENLPPLKWLLGRITEVHHGPDGNIRVVHVRTKDGIYTRGISKICVLPIRDKSNSSSEEI
ncbi:uncharacterized protein LOC131433782 [Malaya genurostris]|uniref:uncharacterized protein LOC131433782 n=1 Tax=Malaya genurostris TaxID=325434 RepID=UPI0026F3C171|nr:uncharacterized protein LOC131433782 [Malaya genurostris]